MQRQEGYGRGRGVVDVGGVRPLSDSQSGCCAFLNSTDSKETTNVQNTLYFNNEMKAGDSQLIRADILVIRSD